MSDMSTTNAGKYEFEDLHKGVSAEMKKSTEEAEQMIKDPEQTESTLKKALAKLSEVKSIGAIKELFDNVVLMISMVTDYIKGKYKVVPVGSIIAILAALIYFLSPIDFLPDFIPGIGYIDDAFVIAIVIKQAYSDMQEYKKWKDGKEEPIQG